MKEKWEFERRAPHADIYRSTCPRKQVLEVPDDVTLLIARRERNLMALAFEKSVKNLTVAQMLELIKGL